MSTEQRRIYKDKEKQRKSMFVRVVWNCAAELKYLLTAFILFSYTITIILQFLPTRFSLSSYDLRSCQCLSSTTAAAEAKSVVKYGPPPPPPVKLKDQILKNGVIKRSFKPYGSAAYNFILMSAYRGGPNTFAVMGLISEPLHYYGKPSFQCQWVQNGSPTANAEIFTTGERFFPDWGYGRIYTVLVVNCTFSDPIVGGGGGGRLLLHATTNGCGDTSLNSTDTIEALSETEEDLEKFNQVYFSAKPKYDYLYCGSSLFGNLSPQRVREWLAYHIRLLGGKSKSHFVIHDAGGVDEQVMEVLKPWIEKGYVTLQDIRDQERFDGYYHNQFLVVNDCLHRYKFMTKWILFFDVDEFLFVPKKSNIRSVFRSLSGYTQFTIEQMPMSANICLPEPEGKPKNFRRKWGFEKLVFKDTKKGIRRDRKYAVQPRNVFATGVHMSENMVGKTTHKTDGRIMYYHYHGTIANRREPCRQVVNTTSIKIGGTPYSVDSSMKTLAGFVKRFELNTIGPILQKTRQ